MIPRSVLPVPAVPPLKAMLSNRVKVVTALVLALINMPLASVFCTARPLMLSVGLAGAVEPTWNA